MSENKNMLLFIRHFDASHSVNEIACFKKCWLNKLKVVVKTEKVRINAAK